jgi:hypothetical protein
MVFANWEHRDLAWHRAIYIEAGEYLEHLGTWKWWKKGNPDFPQANMELVDIWHFALSWYMTHHGKPQEGPEVVTQIISDLKKAVRNLNSFDAFAVTDEHRHVAVDALVADAGNKIFNTAAFVELLAYSGLDFDQLALRYIGKNMLNRFRQDNGYKTGTYVKVWGDAEDNVHLDRIIDALADASAPGLPKVIYDQLVLAYAPYVKN